MDKRELIEVLKKVNDPEFPRSVIDLKIVDEEDISIDDEKVSVLFTPTSPLCPMGGIIGALIKYALEEKTGKKVDVSLKPGTHAQEKMLNDLFRDEKRYKETLERLKNAGILEKCLTG